MIDQELIEKKIDLLEGKLDYLKETKEIKPDKFLDSFEKIQATKHTLQEAIEACLDIANHIIAAKGLQRSETYSGMFQRLAKDMIVEEELADRLGNMARFRNLLVHQYTEVDNRRVHEILQENLDDIEEFITRIEKLLKNERSE
ncbi:hypothetical protein AKJ53_01215 [candidate division MSBL1 archaeon SCGC-AAA382F02]|uniref:DUF86 domain-containing protein n=1 Tax=candidate division MSBL1 archaeon SCGC-AAA382F02 TaxID=1698282 RepID=A0A133VI94_9EURY|nr:hypothetical protein AKJ53_01215 [candidate division MSBL1 archaeon SCGC-AAA382F02]